MIQNKVLFIGLVWPEPSSSAAGKRILQLVDFFVQKGDEVMFCSSATKTEASDDLSKWPQLKAVNIRLNDASFDELLKEFQPDFVVFDRFVTEEQFGWRIHEFSPNAVKILDTEDVHFLRKSREVAYKKGKDIDFDHPMRLREIASILRCDISLIISEVEMNLLIEDCRIDPNLLLYLPFLEEMEVGKSLNGFTQRKDFVFIGNFLHEPNWQAVLHLKKSIWPKIRKSLPNVNLHIYGAYTSQKVMDLHQPKDGFLVHGKAESALEVMNSARILLAPLPFGAGQKGKFIDALQMGTPIATNTIGAEGMFAEEGTGVIEDHEEKFVQKTIELYQNQILWESAQSAGQLVLKLRFDRNLWLPQLKDRLNFIQKHLKTHRQTNFLGQILYLNEMNALKYMSLWIEEKNRKR